MTTAPTGPSGPAGPGPGRDFTGPTQPTPAPLPNPGPPPAPGGRLPALSENIRKATMGLTWAIVMLGRQWDPTTGPQQDDPWDPEAVDISLSSAVADVRSALHELGIITSLISARQSTNSASLPGGPFNHPSGSSDEGLTPGLASAGSAGQASTRIDRAVVAPVEGSSHLAASSVAASGGLLPGLVDAAVSPTAGGTGESNTTRFGREAGESSDPRPRIGGDAPEMTGVPTPPDQRNSVRPGVGQFTVPSAKRWMWSS